MKVTRQHAQTALLMTLLISATVGLRWFFEYIPNFAPVAAVALFAGLMFQSIACAVFVPIASMAIADQLLGGYQPLLMMTVYGMLAMPVLMRTWVRRNFAMRRSAPMTAAAGLLGCTLFTSISFFIVTNGMTWLVTPWYERSLEGLLHCYVSAVPFFRYTLAGDILFAVILFGGYAFAIGWRTSTERLSTAAEG